MEGEGRGSLPPTLGQAGYSEPAAFPAPKFSIGQTVWTAGWERKNRRWPCPDCMGIKKWKVETPAGQTYEVDCQRCLLGYVYQSQSDVIPLDYIVYEAAPKSRVIQRIEIDTRGHFNDGPEVRYDGSTGNDLFAPGCICPPTSEQTCQHPNCGRKNPFASNPLPSPASRGLDAATKKATP